jgi:hypothetical protein
VIVLIVTPIGGVVGVEDAVGEKFMYPHIGEKAKPVSAPLVVFTFTPDPLGCIFIHPKVLPQAFPVTPDVSSMNTAAIPVVSVGLKLILPARAGVQAES